MSTVYHTRQLTMTLAEDEQFAQILFGRNKTTSSLSSRLEEASIDKFKLSDAEGLVAIDLGGVATVRVLYMEADGSVDLTIDGSATPIQYRPAAGDLAIALHESIEATLISVQNPTASSEITVTVAVAGV